MRQTQQLTIDQIQEALWRAAEQQVPLTMTVQREGVWTNLTSCFLAIRDGQLLVEPPDAAALSGEPLADGETVSASFRYNYRKHIFSSTVVGPARYGEGDAARTVL
ncbi:MAG: hypothetical protein J7M14_05745, partial [Planctomycetes bacterium]|nr:hypothetical protein [Planctomycetota bacterium]